MRMSDANVYLRREYVLKHVMIYAQIHLITSVHIRKNMEIMNEHRMKHQLCTSQTCKMVKIR